MATKIYIIAPRTIDINQCCTIFSEFGTIRDASMQGRSKGRYIVEFSTEAEAQRAIEGSNGMTIPGIERPIRSKMYEEKEPSQSKTDPKALFISVQPNTRKEDIRQVFSAYGNVNWIDIREDSTKDNLHHTMVKYTKHSEALNAMNNCDPSYIPRWPKAYEVLQKKEEQKKLESQTQSSKRYEYVRESPLSKSDYEITSGYQQGYGRKNSGYGQQKAKTGPKNTEQSTGHGQQTDPLALEDGNDGAMEVEEDDGVDKSLYGDLPMAFTSRKAQVEAIVEKKQMKGAKKAAAVDDCFSYVQQPDQTQKKQKQKPWGSSGNFQQKSKYQGQTADDSGNFQQQSWYQGQTDDSGNYQQQSNYQGQTADGSGNFQRKKQNYQRKDYGNQEYQQGGQQVHYKSNQNRVDQNSYSRRPKGLTTSSFQGLTLQSGNVQYPGGQAPVSDAEAEEKLLAEQKAAKEAIVRQRTLEVINKVMKADPDTERHLFVEVRMPAGVTEEQTRMLFDCVPGMESCERKPNTDIMKITYESPQCAEYAANKLDKFVYVDTRIKVTLGPMSTVSVLTDTAEKLRQSVAAIQQGKGCGEAMAAIVGSLKQIAGQMAPKPDLVCTELVPYCSVRLPKPKPMLPDQGDVKRVLFISMLPRRHSENLLEDVICRFGSVCKIWFGPDKNYGFIHFLDIQAAEFCKKTLEGAMVDGMELHLEYGERTSGPQLSSEYEDAHTDDLMVEGEYDETTDLYTLPWCSVPVPKLQEIETFDKPTLHTDYRLFVVAMPDPCSETRLKNLFCRFGNFHKFKWQTGQRYGFATFLSRESAERCAETLHGATVEMQTLKIEFKNKPYIPSGAVQNKKTGVRGNAPPSNTFSNGSGSYMADRFRNRADSTDGAPGFSVPNKFQQSLTGGSTGFGFDAPSNFSHQSRGFGSGSGLGMQGRFQSDAFGGNTGFGFGGRIGFDSGPSGDGSGYTWHAEGAADSFGPKRARNW